MTVETPSNGPGNSEPAASPTPPNQVFVLRMWHAGSNEWRGRVQHVTTGETRYFRSWPELVAHLEALLNDESAPDQKCGGGSEETIS